MPRERRISPCRYRSCKPSIEAVLSYLLPPLSLPLLLQEEEAEEKIFAGYFTVSNSFHRAESWSRSGSLWDGDDDKRHSGTEEDDEEEDTQSMDMSYSKVPYLEAIADQLAKGRSLWKEKTKNIYDFVIALRKSPG